MREIDEDFFFVIVRNGGSDRLFLFSLGDKKKDS